ncbi:MAG: porphobilinogen synthase [Solirubrobacteraceae bacterium]|nr:porphobilinogen synthase [Solirubrobacteraceae bacterium]
MAFPESRLRRLRRSPAIRDLVAETLLDPGDLILPIFVEEGLSGRRPITAMPGVDRLGLDELAAEAETCAALGLGGMLLFGVPEHKDLRGSGAYDDKGIVQRAIGEIKRSVPETLVIADVCLCEYTSHGHCGVMDGADVDNDQSLPLIARTAASLAGAGADIVAPSDMMDGRVGAIRSELDRNKLQATPIASYAVKYASAFYGPFRDAADSTPAFGDRKGYQMDFRNGDEALREARADVDEGADLLIVKPALPYLDILHRVKTDLAVPTMAYHVSGEYSMLKAAAHQGFLDERAAVLESLTGLRRGGADAIITYSAKDAAAWLRSL